MRLYHRLFILLLSLLLSACAAPQATQALIYVTITADGQTVDVQLPAGSTVQQALQNARISLNTLDRVEPPAYTVLGSGEKIRIVRVTESFEVEQQIIPFERQTLRNESLAQDKEVLIQKGKNGLRETTYRRVFEDGAQVSSQPIAMKTVILEQPAPEIVMIGIQAPFLPVKIPGRLFYLRDGNAWVIEGSTGNRRALLTTGDLDGRVFSLSSDGNWLLFTRRASSAEQINNLWVASLASIDPETGGPELVDIQIPDVVHFADWLPGSTTRVYFSTVEPRAAAPGWQANNDLNYLTFSDTGWTTNWAILIEPNAGGIYGWWGSTFLWDPSGALRLAYARPDGIGIVSGKDGARAINFDITPLRTQGDWAWVPGLTWSPDGKFLYTVEHIAPPGSASPEDSQLFNLAVVPLEGGPILPLASQVGMFAYPIASPMQQLGSEVDYQIAYLQATFPTQSETSRYRLAIMDRDGSNQHLLFPPAEATGLEPQRQWGVWSPAALPESNHYAVAVLYQGNLWLVDMTTGDAQQVTGDGLTTRLIWTQTLTNQGK